MPDILVLDPDEQRAVMEGPAPRPSEDARSPVVLRLESGERVQVPAWALTQVDDATYRLALRLSQVRPDNEERVVIPLVEEQAAVEKRRVETGRVRLVKHVETTRETIDEPLLQSSVEVERVPVGRLVDAPVEIRHEGQTLIIPVLEEVLVVEKRLMLKEEVHVIRRKTEIRDPQQVSLRREHVTVEREAIRPPSSLDEAEI